MNNKTMPYKTIGIIGGGQLGKMMAQCAKAMGYKVAILDPTKDCPAGQVSDIEITANYSDMEAIKKLSEISDVITYEFENIDYDALVWLEKNANLPQGSHVLKITQHRYFEKEAIQNMGIKVAPFELIDSEKTLLEKVYYPSVLKTTRGGYDGKGQVVLNSEKDLEEAIKIVSEAECILEKFMPYSMEISVMTAKSINGEVSILPVAENIHKNNILHKTIVPARISKELEEKAIKAATLIVENLNVYGLLAVEMFVVNDEIYVNELAPRPHNSGHYSMDACTTGQFEQHIRAICGLPLGDTALLTPAVMINILGDHMNKEDMSDLSRYIPLLGKGKIHLYGKAEAVNKRKMGHINMLGEVDEMLHLLEESEIWEK